MWWKRRGRLRAPHAARAVERGATSSAASGPRAAATFRPEWSTGPGEPVPAGHLDQVDALRRHAPRFAARPARTDWRRAEAWAGTTLPADYKKLVDGYGAGRLGDVLIYAPFAAFPALDLRRRHDTLIGYVRDLRHLSGGAFPPPFAPEPRGLFAWASVDDGCVVGWLPFGDDPDRWPVAVLSPAWDHCTIHPRTASGFLVARFAGSDPLVDGPDDSGRLTVPA